MKGTPKTEAVHLLLYALILLGTILCGTNNRVHAAEPPNTVETAPRSGFDRTDAIVAVGFGGAALLAATLVNDRGVDRQMEQLPGEDALDIADVYGKGSSMALGAAAMYATGKLTRSPRLQAAGVDLAASLTAAWTAVWALKFAVDADRPSGGDHSFPSGHTATAFAAAPVLHRHFGNVAGYAAYGLASMTALARVEDRNHHIADVLAGAAIGIIAGRTLTRHSALQVAPTTAGVHANLTLRF